MIYTVVDIETTGGSHGNRITEIAAIRTDGIQILDSYETLINPEVFIPKSITLLTGITNAMVDTAPRFEEIAEEFLSFLGDTIFIAHNVSFDYSIIKNHFEDLAISFNRKKLCTVRLSRGIIPGYPSYSLGKICGQLGIENHNRHRAMGDTQATVELFHYLITQDKDDFIYYSLNQLNREATLPPNLPKKEFEDLPNSAGVYYLLGEDMKILYVGKAKDIKKRIVSHFTEKSRKKSELLRKIHHVSYQETGNELVALLLESDEIKKHYPPYNKAQKNKSQDYHVCYYEGQDGILRIDVFLKKYAKNSIQSFSSMVMAKDHLYQLVEKSNLCPKYTGLERTKETCYLGDACLYCSNKESKEEYNNRVLSATENGDEKLNAWIVGPGRNNEEKSVVSIAEGDYRGFGFVAADAGLTQDDLSDCIIAYKNNNDIKRILNGFLNHPIPKMYTILKTEVV
ncbi:MAG: DNA polymerase III subunit epsilon [Bacteroidetes bacterium]|nr:MAG: DNA polymerase III subunit epsilon [Bacteroidota bacterium]